MRPALLAFCLTVLALPAQGEADEAPLGTVAVASRLFLAPDLPDRYDEAPEGLLPLTGMNWMAALVDADPLLGPQGSVVHIRRYTMPPSYLMSDQGLPERFGDHARVPDWLRFEGLDVETARDVPDPGAIIIRPEGPSPDWMLDCSGEAFDEPTFEFCGFIATYPRDPAITLMARFYSPEPIADLAPRLPARAERLRPIALRLDVTEAPPADPERVLAALLAANPRLEQSEHRSSP